MSLEGLVPVEPVENAALTIVRAALGRPARDLPTTRRGALGYLLLRLVPRTVRDRGARRRSCRPGGALGACLRSPRADRGARFVWSGDVRAPRVLEDDAEMLRVLDSLRHVRDASGCEAAQDRIDEHCVVERLMADRPP